MTEETPRCLKLRTKMDYVAYDGSPWTGEDGVDENTPAREEAHRYTCLTTMNVLGPDDDLVGPRFCTAERPCYESSGF